MKELFDKAPIVAASISIGILFTLQPASAEIIVAAGAVLFLIIFLSPPQKRINHILLIIGSLLFACGWAHLYDDRNESFITETTSQMLGTIHDVPDINGDQASFKLNTKENERIQVFLRLESEEAKEYWRMIVPGQHCLVDGELVKPLAMRNFHALDYERFLYEQGIHWTFQASSTHSMCEPKESFSFSMLKQWRHYSIRLIEDSFPEELQGVASALLFGDRTYINDETLTAYQDLGLIHLLAISGLHVGIVSGFLYYGFIRFGVTRERAAETLLVLLPMYAILAGAAPSVIRAVIMSMFVLICLRFRFRPRTLQSISLAYIVMILHNPYSLFHIGFQLSFLLTLSIILSVPLLQQLRTGTKQSLLIAVVTQVFSFPLIVYYFHTYSLWSLQLNIIYVPIISVVVLPGMWVLFVLTMIHSSLPTVWFQIFDAGLSMLHAFFHLVHQSETGSTAFGEPSLVWVLFMIALTVLVMVFIEKRRKKLLTPLLFIYVLSVGYPLYSPYLDSSLTVTFINVGQGDSILIELPYKRGVYLIDGGGHISFPQEEWQMRRVPADPGQQTVVPYLEARGINSIDKIIVTHGDYDHFGGLFAVIDTINVKELYYPDVEVEGDAERAFLREAAKKGIDLSLVSDGTSWEEAGQHFRVIHPNESRSSNKNDDSIVLYAVLADKTWLFTGDLEEDGERAIINRYPSMQANVLKVGHHGSRTSTTDPFVSQLQPELAFISAGRNNRFNHPHPEVLETLNSHHVQTFGTYESGAIRIVYAKGQWEIETSLTNEQED